MNKTSVQLSIQWKNCIFGYLNINYDDNNWVLPTRCENRTSIVLSLSSPIFEVFSSDQMILFVSYNNENAMRIPINPSELTTISPNKYPIEKLSFFYHPNACSQIDTEVEHMWLTASSCIDVEDTNILDFSPMQLLKTIFIENICLIRYNTVKIEGLRYLKSINIQTNYGFFYEVENSFAVTTIYIANCTELEWIEFVNQFKIRNLVISGNILFNIIR